MVQDKKMFRNKKVPFEKRLSVADTIEEVDTLLDYLLDERDPAPNEKFLGPQEAKLLIAKLSHLALDYMSAVKVMEVYLRYCFTFSLQDVRGILTVATMHATTKHEIYSLMQIWIDVASNSYREDTKWSTFEEGREITFAWEKILARLRDIDIQMGLLPSKQPDSLH